MLYTMYVIYNVCYIQCMLYTMYVIYNEHTQEKHIINYFAIGCSILFTAFSDLHAIG